MRRELWQYQGSVSSYPVLVVSADFLHERGASVYVLPVEDTDRQTVLSMPLPETVVPGHKLWLRFDRLHRVLREQLTGRVGVVDEHTMDEVDLRLRAVLGL